jgi:hypothetical protein
MNARPAGHAAIALASQPIARGTTVGGRKHALQARAARVHQRLKGRPLRPPIALALADLDDPAVGVFVVDAPVAAHFPVRACAQFDEPFRVRSCALGPRAVVQ